VDNAASAQCGAASKIKVLTRASKKHTRGCSHENELISASHMPAGNGFVARPREVLSHENKKIPPRGFL
jgi:hypothetical protein